MSYREEAASVKAAMQEIIDGAKDRDLTPDEAQDVEAKAAEAKDLIEKAVKSEKAKGLLDTMVDAKADLPSMQEETGLSMGERFVKSAGFEAFRENAQLLSSGAPISIAAKGVGHLADLGVGSKATLTTTTPGKPQVTRLPGVTDTLVNEPLSILNLITTGSTNATSLEYVQIISENDNAAIVPEGELKPLSDMTTKKDVANAYVYADGFDATNEFLADEGALASWMNNQLVKHLRRLIEDKILNGAGGSTEPLGILKATGVRSTAFSTDVIGTIASALATLEAAGMNASAIVMNPADVWALRLLKESGVGYLVGNPFQATSTPTPFGVPLVSSTRIAQGTALVGDFSTVQFLEKEPISVVAFNQHKDYAQRNLTYVRAELRGLQLIHNPAAFTVADLTAA